MNDWSTIVFVGAILVLIGPGAVATIIGENWRSPPRVWERREWVVIALGIIAFFVGVGFVIFGCGASQPEPADPVHVEVDRPASDFEPTMAVYIELYLARAAVAECEAAQMPFEEGVAIRAAARQEEQLLRDEFAAYAHGGQGGPYCGPVCEAMQDFLFEGGGVEILSSCEE